MTYRKRWSHYKGRNKSKFYPQHKGWVYVLSNPSFPGLVKVGYTDRPVERRIEELNDTAIPTPFIKEYEGLVKGANEVEKKAHLVLSKHRHNKEFYKCSPDIAVDAIKEAALLLKKEILHDELFFSYSEEIKLESQHKEDSKIEIEYYDNGNKKVEWPWKGEVIDGLVTWWYEDGAKEKELFCKNGKWHGLETVWYKNGKKKMVRSYEDGNLNGPTYVWYSNGKKKKKLLFKNDQVLSEQSWYKNGNKKKTHKYNSLGEAEGLWIKYYKNGKPKLETEYLAGKKHGLEKEYYESGAKKTETPYKKDLIHGDQIEWFEDGNVSDWGSYYGGNKRLTL